jgi:hypothetical protein
MTIQRMDNVAIYRREDGVWRLVHRHGDGGPRTW